MTVIGRAYSKSTPTLNRALDLLSPNWTAYRYSPKIAYAGIMKLDGNSFDRGLAHGRLFRNIIPDLVRRNLLRPLASVNARLVESKHESLLKAYSRYIPQAVQEMKGIAAGVGIPFPIIFDYNVQPILLLDVIASSCTGIWLRDEDGTTIHAGSLDSGFPDGSYLVRKVSATTELSYLGGMVVGTAWTTFGMNEAGLTISGASVNSRMIPVDTQKSEGSGVDVNSLASVILETASTVEEAKQLIESPTAILPFNSGTNLIISDVRGNVVKVEICGKDRNFVGSNGSMLLCTNHFTDRLEPLNRHDTAYVESLHAASVARYHTLEKYFEDTTKCTVRGVVKLLRKHDQPGAICRHYGREGELGQTTQAYVMIPAQRQLLFWNGNPCVRKQREASLAS